MDTANCNCITMSFKTKSFCRRIKSILIHYLEVYRAKSGAAVVADRHKAHLASLKFYPRYISGILNGNAIGFGPTFCDLRYILALNFRCPNIANVTSNPLIPINACPVLGLRRLHLINGSDRSWHITRMKMNGSRPPSIGREYGSDFSL